MTETQHALRQIAPIGLVGLTPAKPETGMPICELVDPRDLWVDPAYQRQVGERGIAQVRRIIENFNWAKFKPPVCAFAEDENGKSVLKVLDGQHTAIAAASNPHVDQIPVMIVEAADTKSQAEAFIGQNKERLGVTPLQLYYAALAAGDDDALTVARVSERAGVTILRTPPSNGRFKPSDTMAITAITALVNRRFAVGARKVLEVCVAAQMAPITATAVKAVDCLLHEPEYKGQIEPDRIALVISSTASTLETEVGRFAVERKLPQWRAMASVIFMNRKKVRNG